MQLLFIWDGAKPLPENRVKAVETALAMYPDATAHCITRLRHFISDRVQIVSWDWLKRLMQARLGLKYSPYVWGDPMCFSDWARFFWLGLNPGTLYIDTDVTLLKPHPFENESLAMYSAGNICLLYSPESPAREKFIDLIETRSRRAVGLLVGMVNQFSAEWSKPAPADCFRHK